MIGTLPAYDLDRSMEWERVHAHYRTYGVSYEEWIGLVGHCPMCDETDSYYTSVRAVSSRSTPEVWRDNEERPAAREEKP